MNRSPSVVLALCVWMLPAAAHAADAKAPTHEVFAQKLGQGLGQTFDANALDQGVPQALVALIKKRYPQANNHQKLLEEYRGCAKAFEERHQAVLARQGEVDKAVAAAQGQSPADAQKTLAAVMGRDQTLKIDHLGRVKTPKRDVLQVTDAELPAAVAWAQRAVDTRSVEQWPQVRTDLMVRRPVSKNAMAERLMWLAAHCGKHMRASSSRFIGFAAGQKPEVRDAMVVVLNDVDQALSAGAQQTNGFFASLAAKGFHVTSPGSKGRVKKGDWVLLHLKPTKLSKRRLDYKKKDVWKESFNCKPTNIIKGIDPVTGDFQYKYKCETRTKKSLVTLQAKFKSKVNDLAQHKKSKKLWLLAKVKKTGPHWKLTDARLVDGGNEKAMKFLQPAYFGRM